MSESRVRKIITLLAVDSVLGLMVYASKGRSLGMSFVAAMVAWFVFVLTTLGLAVVIGWFKER